MRAGGGTGGDERHTEFGIGTDGGDDNRCAGGEFVEGLFVVRVRDQDRPVLRARAEARAHGLELGLAAAGQGDPGAVGCLLGELARRQFPDKATRAEKNDVMGAFAARHVGQSKFMPRFQVVPNARTPRILAIVQAGGKGSRMDVLTRERAKPALPFGGSYQLIDFALSNLAHSGIPDVWVSVQYQAASLDRHLSGGRPWDLDRTRGGYRRLVPEEGDTSSLEGFSTGNADDLMRMADDIAASRADIVVVTSADHVFRLDVRSVIEEHLAHGAECTLVTTNVARAEARQGGGRTGNLE